MNNSDQLCELLMLAQSEDPAQHNDSFTSEIHRDAKSVILQQNMEISNLLELNIELYTIHMTGKETVS